MKFIKLGILFLQIKIIDFLSKVIRGKFQKIEINSNDFTVKNIESFKEKEYIKTLSYDLFRKQSSKVLHQLLYNPTYCFVFYLKGVKCGYAVFRKSDMLNVAWLVEVGVAKEFQGIGIGLLALKNLVDLFKEKLYLIVEKKNKAYFLYKKIGFDVVLEYGNKNIMVKKYVRNS
jgi:ribosomal protein S18 acetylase RimI-like enzyme